MHQRQIGASFGRDVRFVRRSFESFACEETMNPESITRRQGLVAAGGAMGLIAANATAQPPEQSAQKTDIGQFLPKRIGSRTDIMQRTVEAARRSKLLGGDSGLIVDPTNAYAMVTDYVLPPDIAARVGRRSQVVESVITGITDTATIKRATERLAQSRLPAEIARPRGPVLTFFVRTGRRVIEDPKTALLVSKRHKLVDERSSLVWLINDGKNYSLVMLIEGKKSLVVLKRFVKMSVAPDETGDNPQVPIIESESEQDDANDGACAKQCFETLSAIALKFMAIMCPACVTSLTATPFSLPVSLVLCGACLSPFVVVPLICIGLCEE